MFSFIPAGINKSLEQFTYLDMDIFQLIMDNFYEIDFIGIRGYTRFDKSGFPTGVTIISQQQGV